MIKPLILGSSLFPVNIMQGPLAGVSSAPFRALVWHYSKPAFSCTEMISAHTLLHQPQFAYQRFIEKSPDEGKVCVQLAGSDATVLAAATQRINDFGVELINLNCGCPVKKIRSKGAGSKLLATPSKLYQVLSAIKRNTTLPVSAKIRVAVRADETLNRDVAQAVSDAGIDFLIVHGRHWQEHYETPCRYDAIQYFVEQLAMPVIGNGDIACLASLHKMFATGCAGVMVARASVGQPWLIGKLLAEMQQQPFILPTTREIADMFIEHVARLVTLLGSEQHAILQARGVAKYYARSLVPQAKAAFCERVNRCEQLSEFVTICQNYFV